MTEAALTEAARMLGISRTTAYEAVRDGSLVAIRIRRRIVVPLAWLDDVLATNGTAAPPQPRAGV